MKLVRAWSSKLTAMMGRVGVEFSKKSGLRLWMIWRHFQLTGDQAWLRKMWPRVEREVNQIIEYRSMTRDDPKQANCGLMPIGFGDGGLGGKHREYTNVYWTLAGLKAAIEMAEKVEHTSARLLAQGVCGLLGGIRSRTQSRQVNRRCGKHVCTGNDAGRATAVATARCLGVSSVHLSWPNFRCRGCR